MRVPLSWVNEFIDIQKIDVDTLVEKLTLAGFEVEEVLIEIINKKEEIILNLSATANRPDSLSMIGMSKEIGAILNTTVTSIKDEVSAETSDLLNNVNSHLSSKSKDNQYSDFLTFTLKDLNYTSTPEWVKHRLLCCEIIPQNTIQDLIEYILLETGYPFQLYDLSIITQNLKTDTFHLNIQEIPKDEKLIIKVNGINQKFKIKSKSLGLYANNLIIGLPGIIEGNEYRITDKTQNFLIEGSIFNSKYIRQSSRKLGLRTERSARYEKGINNSEFLVAFQQLINLIKIGNQDIKLECHTKNLSSKIEPTQLSLNLKTINEVLGPIQNNTNTITYLTIKQVEQYLTRLEFNLKFQNDDKWIVEVPIIRTDDITQEIDLIEEIGRLHGCNNFRTKLPKIEAIGVEDFSHKFRKKLTLSFLNEGLNELCNYSLVKPNSNKEIRLNNPLISDCSVLRRSLLPSLIKSSAKNNKQGNTICDGFEYGHVFKLDNSNQYHESEVIGGLFGNFLQKPDWNNPNRPLSWFEAKGKLETIFQKINFENRWLQQVNSNYKQMLHPFRSATIYFKDTDIQVGVFGQINSIIAQQNGLSSNLYLFELDFEILKQVELEPTITMYSEYSSYPKISKDISFIINDTINFTTVKSYIYSLTNELLINIELLDQYSGNTIPLNNSSLCLKLTFQSKIKTLQTNEIDQMMGKIEKGLKIKYDTQIRT